MREFFIEDGNQARLIAFAETVRAWTQVREAVVGAGNCTILFEPAAFAGHDADAAFADAWNGARDAHVATRVLEVPVSYDGEDLTAVAHACGLTPDAVVELHSGAAYRVAFIGFQPGFAYLDGLDARLHLPRRADPRSRVPAGSVAIAGAQSAVYPFASPGGWHLLGTTTMRMFDPQRTSASLLQPGDAVRFIPL